MTIGELFAAKISQLATQDMPKLLADPRGEK
jgi:hypothetical protein